jgi:ElaB/YqjD/DUF883 family membrane-anchored ribosome-binding protein
MAIAGSRTLLIGAAALVAAAAVAWAGYGAVQKRHLQAQMTQLVGEAGTRLEGSLGIDINAPSAEVLKKLDESIQATDYALQQLRSANARSNPALVEAADDYVALAANVLKRQSGSVRGRQKFADSRKALTAHLSQVGQRGPTWLADAVKLRQQLDRDYFEYQTAASSLENMLGSYPESHRRIAAVLPAVALPADAPVKDARSRAQAAIGTTRQELEKAKQLVAPG